MAKYNGVNKVKIDYEDLYKLVRDCPIEADLNWLDTSGITTFYKLFYSTNFNGYIDEWDTNKVEDLSYTFALSSYNRYLRWELPNLSVANLSFAFSEFNFDLDFITIKNNKCFKMFECSNFKRKLPQFNGKIIDFILLTALQITVDQLNDNIHCSIEEWCIEHFDYINDETYYKVMFSEIMKYYMIHFATVEEKISIIEKHNIETFDI